MTKPSWWTCIHKWVYVLLFFLAAGQIKSQSQDWQPLYNQALSKYQSEDFQNSILLAEEAFQKAGSVTPASKAYTVQLITANCIALADADKGLKYVTDEIKLFQQLEGSKSKSLSEALKKEIVFLQEKNQIKQALEKLPAALQSFADSYGENSIQVTQFNVLWGDIALVSGDSAKAKQLWNKCIPAMAANADVKEDYKTLLYNAAALEEKLRDKSAAVKYNELVALLERENQTDDPVYAESKRALSRLQHQPATANETSDLQQLLKKAISLQHQNQRKNAGELYKQCLEIITRENTKDKTSFSVYFNYAGFLIDEGSVRGADEALHKAKSISSVIFKQNDLENLLVELTEADLTLSLGQRNEAVEKYNRLVGRITKEPKAISYLTNSCNLLLNADLPVPVTRLLKTVVCCPDQYANSDAFMKGSLTYCNAMLALNKSDSVLLFLNQPIFDKQLWSEFKKVEALQLQGQWSLAFEKLSKMEAMPTASSKEKAEITYHLAELAHKMGDYIKAENNYLKAQKLFEQASQWDFWQVSNSLATLYSKIGNFEKSEKILTDLLSKVPEESPLQLALLSNLSANYIDTNEFEKAKSIQEKIILKEKELVGEGHPDYAQAISNFAVLYQKQGRYSDARNLLEKALLISKNNFGEQSTDYALKESIFGAVLRDVGDFGNAQSSLSHAERILSEKIGTTHPDYISCEYNLAMVLQRTGNAAKALPLMEHLSGAYKKEILNFFPAMSEQEQVALFNKVNKAIQDYQQFAIEQGSHYPELIDHLFDFRLATKALLLNSSAKTRERILQGSDSQLKSQFVTWISLRDQIGKLYSSGQTASGDQIAQLEARANDLEKNLSLASSSFKKDKVEREVTWSKIQSELHDKEAAVEIIRVKASGKSDSVSYAALVVRKDLAKPQLIVFTNGGKMEGREFSFYKNGIIHLLPNERSYNVYWKPLEAALKGMTKVYLSPDGIYNKLNPATLYDPVSKEFMNNRYRIFLVSSLRDLVAESAASAVTSKTAQLFGPIDFDKANTESNRVLRSFSSTGIASLPGTKTEIEKIDQVLKDAKWSTMARLGKEASEQALKSLPATSILHIATHGFFVDTDDDEKQVVINSNQDDNPLFRSGLILPGSAAEDGFLTAYEVKNLNFDGTDLVVLSACETGSGEVRNGEGVYGLQRAFVISGVKNILMSLWKVDDEATQELMVTFYQKLLTVSSKGDALQQAQAELMKKYPDPFFWGSFVLISKAK